MAQARDRILRRQAVPLADAFASPSAEVDWGCKGQADWSKRVGVALGEKPTKRAILDANFDVLKIG